MNILKGIIRIPLIVITSIMITILVITVPITKIALNQDTLVKTLDNSNIYENIEKVVKETTIENLNEILKEVEEEEKIDIDVEEIINSIEISDLLRNLTNTVIDIVYSITEEELTISDLSNRYVDKFDNYLKEKNIIIPDDVLNDIHESLSEESINEVFDTSEVNDTLKEVKTSVDEVKMYAGIIEVVSIIVIVVLTSIILLLSKYKGRSIMIILVSSITMLLLIEGIVTILKNGFKKDMGELLYGMVSSVYNMIFTSVNIMILIFIVIIVCMIVFRILKKKKEEKMISE